MGNSFGNGMVHIVQFRLIQGLALLASLLSLILFALRPDIEKVLKRNVPSNPMPDAFNGLNDSIPIFMVFLAGTLFLIARINRKRQYLLLLPLLFGPTSCIAGWCLTENLSDPNWFHLFALTTIGMLVSCTVTSLLSITDCCCPIRGESQKPNGSQERKAKKTNC